MTPVVAMLMIDDYARQTCVGCSEILFEQGMLEVVREFPLNGVDDEHSVVIYAIAPGFTLAECREAIKERHIGPAWGEAS